MLENVKGAIFDMDGTLIDSLMIWDVVWDTFGQKFLNGAGFRPQQADDKAVRTMTLADAMQHIHSVYSMGSSGEELLEAASETIVHFYSHDVKLKNGVREFLDFCRSRGMKMCIASATDKRLLQIAIEHCQIEKYFDHILSCSEIGKGKDEPDIYLKAMECLGTGIEETCIFEDSHIAIETAHKIGLKTVGIHDRFNYGHEEIQRIADVYIAEGETLLKLLG